MIPYVSASGSAEIAHGFFVLLEPDRETGEPWVSFFIDGKYGYEMATMKLIDEKTIDECILETIKVVSQRNPNHYGLDSHNAAKSMADLLSPFLNIVLFICSQASEIGCGEKKPSLPAEKRTKRGIRVFPPDAPMSWDVGFRIGAALRLTQSSPDQKGELGGSGVRPHIRRAHWHGFWHGPREGTRSFKLKWIPPIPVKVDDLDAIPAAIRKVEALVV